MTSHPLRSTRSALVAAALLLGTLSACGVPSSSEQPSDTSAEQVWWIFCMNPADFVYRTVNGRTIQQMACNRVFQVNMLPATRQQALTEAAQICGVTTLYKRVGGPYNLLPVNPRGDVAPTAVEAERWRSWACYK